MSLDARIEEEQRTQRRAEVLHLDYIDTSKIEHRLFKAVLSVPEMYQMKVIPLTADEHNIHFGILTMTSQQVITDLKTRFSDQRVEFSIISETGYSEYMRLFDPPRKVVYQDIGFSTDHAAKDMVSQVSTTLEQVRPDDTLGYLVQQSHKLNASDIHMECQKENIRIRFRVDGVLHPVAYLSHEKYHHLMSAVASAANLSTSAEDAQAGHISQTYNLATGEEVTVNLRVETVPTVYGTDVVMRLFNLKLEHFRLDNLGLSDKEVAVVNEVIQHPTGMVLIVGPTGSGKTTTLYSLINTLNTPERKIITLEDPVEYNMPGVVQIPVKGDIKSTSFAEKLRAVLRLDPDIVMVGEIRDQDTARTAMQGALTGHLVLSTFHADSAAAALTRMLDLIGQNPLFTNAMHLVMAQRLVRRLDDSLKKPYQPDAALKSQLQKVVDSFPPNIPRPDLSRITLYQPGASVENPFGYTGQVALREQFVMTPGVREMLRQPVATISTDGLQTKAVEEGMRTMLQDGVLKAIAGLTTIEEVYRVVGVQTG